MTRKEKYKWVEENKGKKLRWSGWPNGEYVYVLGPARTTQFGVGFSGVVYEKGMEPFSDFVYVSNGFEPNRFGCYWELYEPS